MGIILLLGTGFGASASQAERSYLEYIKDGYDGSYTRANDDDFIGATTDSFNKQKTYNFVYRDPNVKSLAHLYWNIGYYDLKNDNAVGDLIKINDCELYKKFSANEFEWSEIVNATRNYIRRNKADFATRFEFIIPLNIETYDEKRNVMHLQKNSRIESKRVLGLTASDASTNYCIENGNFKYGYPRGLILELSRPFTLKEIKVAPEVADAYFKSINKIYYQYPKIAQDRELMLSLRKAYLFLRMQIYTFDPVVPESPDSNFIYIKVLATLEGYSIYGDIGRKILLFNQDFVSDSDLSNKLIQEQVETQIQALLKKANDKGVFH